MKTTPNPIAWYDANAREIAPRYNGVSSEAVNAWYADLLPDAPGVAIDIGAGTGRDAAWLAAKGYETLAVEPSVAMRAEGQKAFPNARIQWEADCLPGLSRISLTGIAADVITLSAVWMHVAPGDRPRAFRKIVGLAKSGGLIVISLRNGPGDDVRGFYPASISEIERLAASHGVAVVRTTTRPDAQGRPTVTWDCIALKLPEDGTGALPLLRHVILDQDKSATYKLGLLRALCRAADGASGMAREADDIHIAVPLGLVGLFWLRLYLPLISANLPQSPTNTRGGEKLGFVRGDGIGRLVCGATPMDLRVGARFTGDLAVALDTALRQTTDTVKQKPALFACYPNGGPIFVYRPAGQRRRLIRDTITIDASYLESFGDLLVPRDVWNALQRFSHWIEPSLIAEWIRLMRGWAKTQERQLEETKIAAAMTWPDPARDTAGARQIAKSLLDSGHIIRCVWSGEKLTWSSLDVDHCFPWSVWPCDALWNLMPAHRMLNQHKKKHKLPTDGLLAKSRQNILRWWEAAYLDPSRPNISDRFRTEAHASLAALSDNAAPDQGEVFGAMRMQRLRLWRDQRAPEWNG